MPTSALFASLCLALQPSPLTLAPLSSLAVDGAEVLAYSPRHQLLLATGADGITAINAADPSAPIVTRTISPHDLANTPGSPSSTGNWSVSHITIDPAGRPIAAAALIPEDFAATQGRIALLSLPDLTPIATIEVGFNPDCCVFTPSGDTLIVANEGQPTPDLDPPGTISLINTTNLASSTDLPITTITFDSALVPPGVRIQPSLRDTPHIDLEPEYITANNTTAWITLQENNAIAIVDLTTNTLARIAPLGASLRKVDAARDGKPLPQHTVLGMPMPDQIASFTLKGRTYLVTADEGDTRGDLDTATLGPRSLAPGLEVCKWTGMMFGARSLSVWDATTCARVGSTLNDFERTIARDFPTYFNSTGDNPANTTDRRSTVRGPEPEGVLVTQIQGVHYALVSIERPGMVALIDLSDPTAPALLTIDAACARGHLAPEGMCLLAPNLAAVAYERSGTIELTRITPATRPTSPD